MISNSNISRGNENSKGGFLSNYNKRKIINSNFNQVLKNKMNNINNINIRGIKKEEFKFTDGELNSLSYYEAIDKDKRTFFQTYISLIKTNQLLFFAFKCKNDYNSRIIKFCFFIFIFALLFFINTLFINENVLHNIFLSGGKLAIFNSIPIIFYSILITSFIKNILLKFIFTEYDILSMKEIEKTKSRTIKGILAKITLKCLLFFFISEILVFLIWLYIACFFTVFKNTQIFAIKNTLISFVIFLIVPFAYYTIPALLRIISLDSRERKSRLCLYICSKILLLLL